MVVALIALLSVVGGLGLVGICAVLRAGQCSRRLEQSPDLAAPVAAPDLRRAA